MDQFLENENLTVTDNKYSIKGEISGILELDKLPKDCIFSIEPNAIVKMIAKGTLKNSKLNFEVKEHAVLNLSIVSFGQFDDVDFNMNLLKGAECTTAFADFTKGKNHSKVTVNLNGQHSSIVWHLASLAKNADDKVFDVFINHNTTDTYSNSMNYGVCEENSSLSFLGLSNIKLNSARSTAFQAAKIMVFDEGCKAKASPSLCIANNDVTAAHSATCGQINAEHIYYLQSRGISEKEAKRLITLGYLNPILQYFADDEVTANLIKEKIEER
jgi:Fe-S cluster assembly protein SufD